MSETPEQIWIDSLRKFDGFIAVAGANHPLPHNGGLDLRYTRTDIVIAQLAAKDTEIASLKKALAHKESERP